MYPTCIEFKAADGKIAKGVKTFLSEDKEYSHQQIQQFKHWMSEIICEKLYCPLNHWIRYSDGFGASPVQVRMLLQTYCVQQKITR